VSLYHVIKHLIYLGTLLVGQTGGVCKVSKVTGVLN